MSLDDQGCSSLETMIELTLEQVEEKLDEIVDEKYQCFMDIIKSEIDQFSFNTPEHQINKALKRYFK